MFLLWVSTVFTVLSAPPVDLVLGATNVRAEVADDPSARAYGLMGRTALNKDMGMLFVYPNQAKRSFWMKNTPVALSIAFISASGQIVHIAKMVPLDEAPVPSIHPTMYALEMSLGWFEAHGVSVGQTVAGLPGASSR
jgi:uncharacterized membrane protein (UPF0127 family)